MTILHALSMGGYGFYVWPAYGMTLLVLGINIFLVFREKNAIKKIMHRKRSLS